MKIGKKIKDLRNKYNLTQEELADRLELSKGYISQLENDLTEPSLSSLEDIVHALGTNLSDFFKDDKQSDQIVFKKDEKNSQNGLTKEGKHAILSQMEENFNQVFSPCCG